ncbi:uncharacterized protein LOC118438165 [Folsomia candida]|uniref:Uncharacterized protein n=1 Tax=Folsomia candida TaxID=158441 RepID=A0A226DGZ1_FOLCA|nr:uncharacterized protein LOC118438165 [Folsomia candida]OXA44449.1 hypothetical protein Fcan01_20485 [Folsomia candida]
MQLTTNLSPFSFQIFFLTISLLVILLRLESISSSTIIIVPGDGNGDGRSLFPQFGQPGGGKNNDSSAPPRRRLLRPRPQDGNSTTPNSTAPHGLPFKFPRPQMPQFPQSASNPRIEWIPLGAFLFGGASGR